MKLLTRYLFLTALLFCQISFAQSFITKVSSTTIGENDVLEIQYEATNVSMEQFVLPRFDKWTVISGPNLSSSTVQTGKIVKQQMVYSVLVQPNATGALTVPGATALIDNKPKQSNSLSVVVKNISHLPGSKPTQAAAPSLFDPFPVEDEIPMNQYLKKGEKAIDKIKNNIVIRLELNKHSCYVGEPILATYKLCTRLRSKSKVVKQPQFNGCTVVELTDEDQNQHVEKINGVQYNVFVIRKVQLMPLYAGKLVLPQASVENKVSFYDASNLSYRDLYYTPSALPSEEQMVTLQNKPETIDVKELPPMPAIGNADFSGAIGTFDAAVAIRESGVTTNTTNHLLFIIQGQGNMQQLKAPVIKWPKGIEAFEATEQYDEDKSKFPVKCEKTFSFPFIADKKGNYTFPPVAFTYFDEKANRYVTKTTHAFTLPVAKGKRNFFRIANTLNDEKGFQNRLYIILGTAIAAILTGLIWYNRRHKNNYHPVKPTVKKEEKPAADSAPDTAEFIYAIRELQPDNISAFYKQLSTNLQSYLQHKFNLRPDQLSLYMEQNTENAAMLEQFKNLSDKCNLGMYTPVFTIEQAMEHRLEAIEILSRLEST